MDSKRFAEIMAEEGIDQEWSDILWVRCKAEPTEAEVREAAKRWKQYGDEGGF